MVISKHIAAYTLSTLTLLSTSNTLFAQATGRTAAWVGNTFIDTPCKGGGQGYGPYDYTLRNNDISKLEVVEKHHFTRGVEQLTSGVHGEKPWGDLDYTLRAWPNHHIALNTAIRARLRNKTKAIPQTGFPPAECYLQRAIDYSPNDGIAHMLYGMLLHQMGYLDEARDAYGKAERVDPDNVQIKYNTGLLLVDLKRYEEAKEYANAVYSKGFPLPGLQRKLEKQGY